MSQLFLLRRALQKQQCHVNTCLQLQLINKVAQCSNLKQKGKGSAAGESLQINETSRRTEVSTDVRPLGEKIKENTKTATYTAVILAGVGVTAVMFWAICRELFSSSSPNNIYSDALERVLEVI